MAGDPEARLMDGAALSRTILEGAALRAAAFTDRAGRPPCLAAVLVGHDPASVTYVKMKQGRCRRVGSIDVAALHWGFSSIVRRPQQAECQSESRPVGDGAGRS